MLLSGGDTLDASASRYQTARAEGKSVKVGAERVPVFTLLAQRQAAPSGGGHGFLGRAAEREKLHALAHAALRGAGKLCVVTAGAGLGKTALISAALARLKAEGAMRVVVAHASQAMRHTKPLYTVRQFLARWASADARPAAKTRALELAARTLNTPQLNAGSLYRCGERA